MNDTNRYAITHLLEVSEEARSKLRGGNGNN